jgi:hypothetical protein
MPRPERLLRRHCRAAPATTSEMAAMYAHRHTADTGHAKASAAKASFKRASGNSDAGRHSTAGRFLQVDFWTNNLVCHSSPV